MTLTLDDMRADLAAALDLPPEAIGMEENVYDLGLDSMRLMDLMLRWEAAGVAIDYGVLSERLTLAAWWAEAERLQSGA
ncbi:phosphopantetheine-binding protein [Ruixingdingia sedimenti]|uniref:Phosphopantetheine-binding protein n=1 Tax=Ruixingdingia sedimenti TaxID=3073604 RepID=A0ABU1F2H7_9RHOB|nr:phosphopantetheine-binding protein [Xinfangfangia sp. LG-4]MDR5651060.1 phosphopantetheine-binding protein [Xinfangfangia sp. LG-4]